jgi:hypothetical protein
MKKFKQPGAARFSAALDRVMRALRRGSGRPKVLIGIGLLMAAVGIFFVGFATKTHPVGYLVARHTLTPAVPVSIADFGSVDATFESNPAGYLRADQLALLQLSDRAYPSHVIASGQLIQRSDLVRAVDLTSTTLTLTLALKPTSVVGAGSVVDIWATEPKPGSEPMQIAQQAQVIALSDQPSSFGGGSTSVQLVVNQGEVSGILSAVAGSSQLAIVPLIGGS